jgi:hypothetical protein
MEQDVIGSINGSDRVVVMPNTLIREGYLDSDRVSALSDFDDRVFFRVLLAADGLPERRNVFAAMGNRG